MVNVTHKNFNGGVAGLMERIKQLSSQKVCVGVPSEDDPDLSDQQKKQIERKDEEHGDIGNADLVYIHTHGVRPQPVRESMRPEINKGTKYSVALQMYIHEHGSFAYQVPPRPIIEPAIKNSKEGIGKMLVMAANQAAKGNDPRDALEDAGGYAAKKVQNWFTDPQNGWAPNSPATVRQKGSSQPLIDTGALQESITFVIRKG